MLILKEIINCRIGNCCFRAKESKEAGRKQADRHTNDRITDRNRQMKTKETQTHGHS